MVTVVDTPNIGDPLSTVLSGYKRHDHGRGPYWGDGDVLTGTAAQINGGAGWRDLIAA